MGWKESCAEEEEFHRCKGVLEDALEKLLGALEGGDKDGALHWEAAVAAAEHDVDEHRSRDALSPVSLGTSAATTHATYVLGHLDPTIPLTKTVTTALQYRCSLISKHMRLMSKLILSTDFLFILVHYAEGTTEGGGPVETLLQDIATTVRLTKTMVVHKGRITEEMRGLLTAPFSFLRVEETEEKATAALLNELEGVYAKIDPHADRLVAKSIREENCVPQAECGKLVILRASIVHLSELLEGPFPEECSELLNQILQTGEKHMGKGRCGGVEGMSVVFVYSVKDIAGALQCAERIIECGRVVRERSRVDEVGSCFFPNCALHIDDVLTCGVGGDTAKVYSTVGHGVGFCESLLLLSTSGRIPSPILASSSVKNRVDSELGLSLQYTFSEVANAKRINNAHHAIFTVSSPGSPTEDNTTAITTQRHAYFERRRALADECIDISKPNTTLMGGHHIGPNATVEDPIAGVMPQSAGSLSLHRIEMEGEDEDIRLNPTHTTLHSGKGGPQGRMGGVSEGGGGGDAGSLTRGRLVAHLREGSVQGALSAELSLPLEGTLMEGIGIRAGDSAEVTAEQLAVVMQRVRHQQ